MSRAYSERQRAVLRGLLEAFIARALYARTCERQAPADVRVGLAAAARLQEQIAAALRAMLFAGEPTPIDALPDAERAETFRVWSDFSGAMANAESNAEVRS